MKRRFFLFTAFLLVLASCNNDDGINAEVIPPRMLDEQAAEDDASIRAYLQTHFYNYEEFENPPADFDFKIRIDTLDADNQGKTPLIEQVETVEVVVRGEEFNLEQDSVTHNLYVLKVNPEEASGPSPSVADSVYVRYKGSLLDGRTFDGAVNTPVWFDLAAIQGPLQGARGFSEGVAQLNSGGDVSENPDGTISVENYGIGLIIMPSGLGYYNESRSSIPAYSPLMFEIDLYAMNVTDHDRDGINSIDEDLNGNGYLYDDNTDIQAERDSNAFSQRVNFLDDDDDQDGILTIDEIIINEDGTITFPDSDNDGVVDYLDAE